MTSPATAASAPLSWGMFFLLLFILVVVGRIQEVFPVLVPLRVGLVTGGLAALVWLFASGSLRDKIPLDAKQVRYLAMLLGLSVVTIPISVWPGHSFDFLTEKYWKIVLLFLLVLYWARSLQDMRRLLWVCCLGAIGLAVSGIMRGEGGIERFYTGSMTHDPNDLALMLVMILPFVFYLLSASRFITKLLLLGMAFVCLYSIMLTQSRGGLLALLVVGSLILWRSTLGRSSKVAIVAIALLVFAGLAGVAFWDRMETMWDPKTEYDRTVGGRMVVWKTGLMLLATHPWGVGIDGFTTAEGYSHEGRGKWNAPHNSFLQIGVDLGLAGLIVFLLLLIRTLKELGRIRASHSGTETSRHFTYHPNSDEERMDSFLSELATLAATLKISLWGFLVGGFFLSQAYSGLLYVVLALALACIRLAKPLEIVTDSGPK